MALNDALRVEQFNGQVFTEYQLLRVFEPQMMIHRIGGIGERINYPVLETQVAENLADGQTMGRRPLAPRAPELDLDDPIKTWQHIPKDLADVRPELELIESYGDANGRDVANGESGRLLAFLLSCADSSTVANQIVGDFTVIDTLGANTAQAIRQAAAFLDNNGVPGQGRWGMLGPDQWLSLLAVDGVMRKDFGGMANVRMPGDFLEYAGFVIRRVGGGLFGTDFTSGAFASRFASKYQYNAVDQVGVFWHRESWALRRVKSPETLVDWQSETDEWKIESRSHMGTACIKTDGIVRLEDNIP